MKYKALHLVVAFILGGAITFLASNFSAISTFGQGRLTLSTPSTSRVVTSSKPVQVALEDEASRRHVMLGSEGFGQAQIGINATESTATCINLLISDPRESRIKCVQNGNSFTVDSNGDDKDDYKLNVGNTNFSNINGVISLTLNITKL